jgi:hypothetical protein
MKYATHGKLLAFLFVVSDERGEVRAPVEKFDRMSAEKPVMAYNPLQVSQRTIAQTAWEGDLHALASYFSSIALNRTPAFAFVV